MKKNDIRYCFEIEEEAALLQNTAGAALDSAVAMDAQG